MPFFNIMHDSVQGMQHLLLREQSIVFQMEQQCVYCVLNFLELFDQCTLLKQPFHKKSPKSSSQKKTLPKFFAKLKGKNFCQILFSLIKLQAAGLPL